VLRSAQLFFNLQKLKTHPEKDLSSVAAFLHFNLKKSCASRSTPGRFAQRKKEEERKRGEEALGKGRKGRRGLGTHEMILKAATFRS